MTVRALWGVGPATAERLAHLGVRTIGDMERLTEDELVASLGSAHGRLLFKLARARDDRPVSPEREWKSVSVEDTFDTDIADARLLAAIADRMSTKVAKRLADSRLSGRTVTVKARLPDFATVSRSATLRAPTDDPKVVSRVARRLLDDVLAGTDARAGLRLLGVGVSGLADWVQDDLFARAEELAEAEDGPITAEPQGATADDSRRWRPGADVVHDSWGQGWVWGAGIGRVTVRFESRHSEPGPVRTFASDDPDLHVLSGHSQTSRAD
jgi:DNA polymerase-4